MAQNNAHLDELLKLSSTERSVAAEALLVSLEEAGAADHVQQSWVDELKRRVATNAEGIPADEVFAHGRAHLRSLQ